MRMRYAVACIFALLLTGCDSYESQRVTALRAEIKELESMIRRDEAERRAELDYWMQQVAFAAACDYVIPVCPASITEAGRSMSHFGPGPKLFWLLVTMKFFAFGALIAGSMLGAIVALNRVSMFFDKRARGIEQKMQDVQRAELRARQLNENADAKLEAATRAEREQQQRLQQLEKQIAHASKRLDEKLISVQEIEARAEAAEARQRKAQQLIEATRGAFD